MVGTEWTAAREAARGGSDEPAEGERFTFGLLYDVSHAIEAHGYKLDGQGLVELQQHLFSLLHGDGGASAGRTLGGADGGRSSAERSALGRG